MMMAVLLLAALAPGTSHAAASNAFVRIACVPESGLLDVESRTLHDSVSADPMADKSGITAALSRAGFHRPRGLRSACNLDGVLYEITAARGDSIDLACGADPDVYLTVTRNGANLFSHVVFGASCPQRPSLMRFSVIDGTRPWRARETRACYATGKDGEPEHCDWISGPQPEFEKRFPVDQSVVERIGSRRVARQ